MFLLLGKFLNFISFKASVTLPNKQDIPKPEEVSDQWRIYYNSFMWSFTVILYD